jgi:hypothetical protein
MKMTGRGSSNEISARNGALGRVRREGWRREGGDEKQAWFLLFCAQYSFYQLEMGRGEWDMCKRLSTISMKCA